METPLKMEADDPTLMKWKLKRNPSHLLSLTPTISCRPLWLKAEEIPTLSVSEKTRR